MTTAPKQFAANWIFALLPHEEAEIIPPHTELVEMRLGANMDEMHRHATPPWSGANTYHGADHPLKYRKSGHSDLC